MEVPPGSTRRAGVRLRLALALALLGCLLGPGGEAASSKKKRSSASGLEPGARVVPVEELLEYGKVQGATGSGSSSGSSRGGGSGGRADESPKSRQLYGLTDDDFVYATGTCRERMLLAKSTRAWRRGLRGFFLTDVNDTAKLAELNAEGAAGHAEAYAYFPNDGEPGLGGLRHGRMAGDTRAAAAPFAAYRHYGDSFKWMLYGDDDTLFYLDALKHMLSEHDPELPLAFSDNLWYDGRHPNPHAPRCLPCGMTHEELPTLAEVLSTPHMQAQIRKGFHPPISEEVAMEIARNATPSPGRKFVPRPACPYCTPKDACPEVPDPRRPCKPSGAHGGAGMVFSVGLFRHVAFPDFLKCITSLEEVPGGDYLMSYCLWQAGIAFTDPGPIVRARYDPRFYVFSGNAVMGYLFDPIGMLTHGRCDALCRWAMRNSLALHVMGRHYRSFRVSSMHMWGVAYATTAAHEWLQLTYGGDGESGSQTKRPYGMVDDVREARAPAASGEGKADSDGGEQDGAEGSDGASEAEERKRVSRRSRRRRRRLHSAEGAEMPAASGWGGGSRPGEG
ncbi:hypothetical protein HYH02_002076 [Chlamydomonas schloesseri]|uniref:Hexosyltransferase n=1 Tax=Chlamydomonas schloesseri TaxID=2026947 RepID=A0A835WTE0_9CHLO|nr:hypothetical protein HYH02_002076 [Chlamydomonas schloesseri]|eukprot:KAG2453869.1 hypothetical protein HYH02_002076 [Chlamydomonas schloesseri]